MIIILLIDRYMSSMNSNCAILADRNTATSEGIRGLLETEFDSVYLVANAHSLIEGVERLQPRLIVVDQFVGLEALQETLHAVHTLSPESRVITLVIRDHSMIAEAMLAAGADAVILKSNAGKDLFEALLAFENGKHYISPGFNAASHQSPRVRNEA